jgi:hypothetical protein
MTMTAKSLLHSHRNDNPMMLLLDMIQGCGPTASPMNFERQTLASA